MNNYLSKILETDKEHHLLFNLFFTEYKFEIDYSSIDYNRLFVLIVKKHRIVNYFFDKADLSLFPQKFVEKLKKARIRQKQRALQQLSILLELKEILANFDFIVLKGLPLSQQLYNDFAYRDSNDVDILIQAKDEKEILNVLQKKDFETSHNQEHHFVLKKYNISIEIHRKLNEFFDTKKIEADSFKNIETITIQNNIFNVLNKKDQYDYLLMNGFIHHWSRLSWVIDFINLSNNSYKNDKLSTLFRNTFFSDDRSFESGFISKSILIPQKETFVLKFKRSIYLAKISENTFIFSIYKSFLRMLYK